uniref:Uncharacterized protein n=1 Tax=Leptobrachium leishanense TaxID=445787 RepID=A0A8C5QD67_9ANUR
MDTENCVLQLTEPLTGDSSAINEKNYKPRNEMIEYQDVSSQTPQSIVVTVIHEDPPIKDYLLLSVFNIVCVNLCCLGFLALVFSVKCRDRKLVGDLTSARSYSLTARSLNIATTVLTSFFICITLYLSLSRLPPLPTLVHTLNAMISGK